jgi:soluble P-type ATPase
MLQPGVAERLVRLTGSLAIHVVTGDSVGSADRELAGMPCALVKLEPAGRQAAKLAYLRRLGCERSACVGNGSNERLMLAAAALAILVIQREGAAAAAVSEADIVCTSVLDVLDLLACPLRLVATLRR